MSRLVRDNCQNPSGAVFIYKVITTVVVIDGFKLLERCTGRQLRAQPDTGAYKVWCPLLDARAAATDDQTKHYERYCTCHWLGILLTTPDPALEDVSYAYILLCKRNVQ